MDAKALRPEAAKVLILSRKVEEAILIGGVRVLVVDIDRGRVLLGIEAPKDIPIVREELLPR